MGQHPIDGLLDSSMKNLRTLVDVDAIIGDPITTPDGGTTIIPVSKVSFGFVSGGSDISSSRPKDLFGGGSGGGVTITPIAFLVIQGHSVRMLELSGGPVAAERIVAAAPDAIEKLIDIFKKDKNPETSGESEQPLE